jgi:putative DNA primase/helicase
MEHPEKRQFGGNPVTTVLGDRGRYIAAAFCVVGAYLAAGRPIPARKVPSFEGWGDSMRSSLMWLGRANPCATIAIVCADDPERMTLAAMLTAWSQAIGTRHLKRLTVTGVLAMIDD